MSASRVLPGKDVQLGWIGESLRRVDGIPKTTGEFEYASDLQAAVEWVGAGVWVCATGNR